MVLLRKLSNGDAGTSTTLGGNDTDKVADYFNDVDVSEIVKINTDTRFRSGKASLRDGSNAFNISLKSATQTADRDWTIPALVGNDSPATLGLNNIFTAIQQITLDADTLINLYRPSSVTNSLNSIGFYHRNSSNASTKYASIASQVITNTAGLEDGKIKLFVKKAGVDTEVLSIDKNSLLTVSGLSVTTFSPASISTGAITATGAITGTTMTLTAGTVGGILLNTGVIVTTASSAAEFDLLNYTVPANLMGANGCLRVRISGLLLQNNASSQTFQIKVKFGGTTILDSVTQSMAQQSANRPFIMQFVLGNNNATNAQSGSGSVRIGLADVAATVGDGDINDDETQVNSHFSFGTSTANTTSNQALVVTMTMSTSSSTVSTTIRRRTIEFLPGV